MNLSESVFEIAEKFNELADFLAEDLESVWQKILTITKEKKEVDFCIVNDDKPELLIEVKRSDPKPADALLYFTNKYGVPGMQLVLRLKREKQIRGVEIRRGLHYLKSLLI